MIEFVECPLFRKRITLDRCRKCPGIYHGGIRLTLLTEKIESNGGAGDAVTTQINEQDLLAFKVAHPMTSYQITVRERFLSCLYPRRIPLETVED